MHGEYFPPKHEHTGFHCPHCNVYTQHDWFGKVVAVSEEKGARGTIRTRSLKPEPLVNLAISFCTRCEAVCVWFGDKMVHPRVSLAAFAQQEMPDEVKKDYDEARNIVQDSARGAAALLRLAIQKLMPYLGEKGKKVDDDIASLVKKGLRIEIQQALDSVRVIGNESVHPGEIDLRDDPETANALFGLVNLIVEDRISQPRKISEIYSGLPASKLKGIEDRDKQPR
jgi:hypothetical protein